MPHLDPQTMKELLDSTPPFLRKARSEGVPSRGSGAVYPVDEADFTVAPFRIPDYWPRGYGMDVGWNKTAVVWGAHDRDTDTIYLTSEHYRGQAEPSIHAEAVKARGEWIPGVIDPAAMGSSQKDGEQLIAIYRSHGLDVVAADNAVEAGLFDVWQRLSTGRLKVFTSLVNLLKEMRNYNRDEKGKIVKKDDHACDAMRYLIRPSGMARMIVKPVAPIVTNSHVGDRMIGY